MFRIHRKLVLLLLVVVLTIPNIAMAEGLGDIDESIYKVEIEKLLEDGIISGFPDFTFKPEANITRAEFAKVLAISLKLDTAVNGTIQFEDVKGAWHEGYIEAIFEEGLMIGTSDNTFAPDTNITREEIALVLVRAFDLLDIAEKSEVHIIFIDQNEISPWAEKAVMLVNRIGLFEGIKGEDGIAFFPKEFGDRQIVAKLVYELQYNSDIYDKRIEELAIVPEVDLELGNLEGTTNEDLDSIVSKYTKELNSLQTKVQAQLDSLVSQAQSEYDDGESLTTLYKKYESLARELETSTDSKVSSIIKSMEEELKENGYDNGAVLDLYSEYESIKAEQEINIKL